jgi:ABC-type polysaccharide/polyol phosphate export permease
LKYIREFIKFYKHINENKKLIKTLVLNDFKKQYFGSYLGLFWAYAQPITFILVIWFVFEIGFRSTPTSVDTPFFLWLISGMIPWFFFANGLSAGTNSIISNAFLVKKVNFRVSILPLVQIGSVLIIHVTLVMLLIIAFLLYGYMPSIYWLQIFYYIGCSLLLLFGLTWLTSSIRVFIKDIGNFIAVIIQIGFWATPIFWSVDKISQDYLWIIKLNPMYYITSGFRDTFINHIWFWERGFDTLFFLLMSTIVFFIGAIIFRRLRPHFGDVL